MKDFYTIGETAKILNVHRTTLQRWDRTGVLKSYRLPSGRRRYSHQQIQDALVGNGLKECFIYISFREQDNYSDVSEKITSLKDYALKKKYEVKQIFVEKYGKCLKTRKKLRIMLKALIMEKPKKLLIENKKRFVHEGFEYVEEILNCLGTEIEEISLEDNVKDYENDVIEGVNEKEMAVE
ncbi:recombinase family protein [bacterium]|nr:recombinase family protein [bacterium]